MEITEKIRRRVLLEARLLALEQKVASLTGEIAFVKKQLTDLEKE
jgi:hypothetical protein